MKKYVCMGLAVLFIAAVFLTGTWYGRKETAGTDTSKGRRVLYYVDPMNPSHTSDKPGIAPCGMKMEPVYTDEKSGADRVGGGLASMPAGTVQISPENQQLIGVRIGTVEKKPHTILLRTSGRVASDETRVYRLNAAVDGWIRAISGNSTGSLVKKDEVLATFYGPEFLAAQQAYIYALSSLDRFEASGKETPGQINVTKLNVQQYVDSLRNLGMSDFQIAEIGHSRQYTENISIVAPAAGFIIARNVSLGQRFDKGTEWYRIADLSRVWIQADLYGKEAEYVRPGLKVRATLPDRKRTFDAVVSKVLPQFDATSRTLKVRLEADNPGYMLRPDMFVDVDFPVTLPAAVTVPADAVLDSGMKKTVFADRGNGFFEPRPVETGWRFGDRVEITKGLIPGERIVISGNFLIDSESKMRMAATGRQTAPQDQRARDSGEMPRKPSH